MQRQSKVKRDIESKGIDQNILANVLGEILSSEDGKLFTYKYLIDKYGLKSRRVLRKYIEVARIDFKAPIANPGGGYKKANSWNDYKETFSLLVKHSITVIKTQNAVRKEFARRMNLSLFDQSVFNTEFEDIIKAVDQYQDDINAKSSI
ncbi:MAG: hypothetical protein PHS33_08800 [Candidatus Omnitrophica bacterium]|jgi:hypothetical protein|nr:hypothetical protein [Candidatus Omnitrophota bacterium]